MKLVLINSQTVLCRAIKKRSPLLVTWGDPCYCLSTGLDTSGVLRFLKWMDEWNGIIHVTCIAQR